MTDERQTTASEFIEAIKTIAGKPENLENLELYLTRHFYEWLDKYARTPEDLTAEMKHFAGMEI